MRQVKVCVVSFGVLVGLAAGVAMAQEAAPGPFAKAVSPDVAPGVRDVAAFVAEAGYLAKGTASAVEDARSDGAVKAPGSTQNAATPESAPAAPEAAPAAPVVALADEPASAAQAPSAETGAQVVDPAPTPAPVTFPEDIEALHALGLDLVEGRGRAVDEAAAAQAFRRAAEAGHPGAMFELGWAFETGRGVAPAIAFALRWYERAVAAGEPRAMNNLGWLYANGRGVPRDPARAVALYRQGAEAGEPSAMSNLGWMLENGIGAPQDLAAAAGWYARAAAAGDTQAMLNLGNLHLVGDGVAQDAAAALDWFARAQAAGRAEALSYIGEVYEKTPEMRDPDRAAAFYLQALEAGDTWPEARASRSWDEETARALQLRLAERGLYDGPIDGLVGAGTRAAMRRAVGG